MQRNGNFHLDVSRLYDACFFSLDLIRKGDSKEKCRDAVMEVRKEYNHRLSSEGCNDYNNLYNNNIQIKK